MVIKETGIHCPTTLTDAYFGKQPNNCEWVDDKGESRGKVCNMNCPENARCNWITAWGGMNTMQDGRIIYGSFSLNKKITIYIVGSDMRIIDLRHDGKTDVWEYASDERMRTKSPFYKYHELEPEKCEKYLNAKGTSKFWTLFQRRAKEIYDSNKS